MLLLKRKETDDMLRLLAAFGGDDEYEPPSVTLAEALEDAVPFRERQTPQQRHAEVAAFIFAAGGDG